ncbi:MAG TPA: hypothetical protein VIK18_21305 [Pirellulales bacterium]
MTITAILRAHRIVDGHLAAHQVAASSPTEQARWARRRMLNDYAYFMLIFGQFEDRVNRRCEALIRKKRQAPTWKQQRLWDTTETDRLGFMRRVALLTQIGQTDYNRIRDWYNDIRCPIAHGDTASVGPIVLPVLAAELATIMKRLART